MRFTAEGVLMPELQIGTWVKRQHRGKWHLVESLIEGDAVTKCGRRMADRPDAPFRVSEVMPLTRMIGQPQLCNAGCDRPGMVVRNNEDDGSTVNETVPA